MNTLRKNPLFTLALVTLSLVVLAEAWSLQASYAAWRSARRQLDQARREMRAMNGLRPVPTAENAALIEEDLADNRHRLAALQAELAGDGPAADEWEDALVPLQRSGAFFDIAAFVEKLRDLAEHNGVRLKPDERFSFSAYANEAPESGRISAVFHERMIVQHLLETLIAAHPHEVLLVQRERARQALGKPASAGALAAPPGRLGGAGAGDYFEMDPRFSLRVPGAVETRAFRVSFTGYTPALREWLNWLADSELPLLVRMVEVAPSEAAAKGVVATADGTGPLIPRRMSRFVVTVEWIDPGTLAANGI